MEVIRSILNNTRHDVSYNVKGFIKIRKEKNANYSTIAFFVIIFFIIYLLNSDDGEL